ncbi:MAG: hypothetical protein EAZ91_10105 [Cytophagales bacterium]|nr:MAG: hypothetical protein EAZ91_10105 [Cytophagales bacterium]
MNYRISLLASLFLLSYLELVGQLAFSNLKGQLTVQFSAKAGNKRSFFVSLPPTYSRTKKHKLVVVFPGTDTRGKAMKAFVGDGWNDDGLEANMSNAIFVYPDPKWRYFADWKSTNGGWLLGPHGGAAAGMEDIHFVGELLDWMIKKYAIDTARIFATGHSWGGDMTAVVGCFLGNRFRAIAPVAANRPYWFESGNKPLNCSGAPAVWTFFSTQDEHFEGQEPKSGDFGKAQNAFWRSKYACRSTFTILDIEPYGESVEYVNCTSTVRFTLYSPDFSGESDMPGHQPPDFYLREVPRWFNSF